MSPDTFSAAGLSKLSPEELEVLNRWLYGVIETERRVAVEEAVPRGEESFGLEDVTEKVRDIFRDTPEVIESRVMGDFDGWSGKTVFQLENGQVWEQIEAGKFRYPKGRGENPVLIIRKAMFGSYLLKVDGMGTTIRVKRIR